MIDYGTKIFIMITTINKIDRSCEEDARSWYAKGHKNKIQTVTSTTRLIKCYWLLESLHRGDADKLLHVKTY